MRWRRSRQDMDQIEDRRGAGGGGGMRVPGGRVGGGLGGLGIVGVIVAILFTVLSGGGASGFAPDVDLDGLQPTPPASSDFDANAPDPDEGLKLFLGFVMRDVQQTWTDVFAEAGRSYEPTRLVLFTGQVRSGCGVASAASGPFYCPVDRLVYLDVSFFRELRDRFGAPGDFAQAYVIAHEVGHHVQNIVGTLPQVTREQNANPGAANALSVRLELQADCYAGIWGHSAYTRQILENGDLEEGLRAAASIGDDAITGGRVSQENFTHGTSEQRTRWFLEGFRGGQVPSCDTFQADQL